MQTKYNLLYRYMNETTNTAITNEAEYEKTEEFYAYDHKFNMTRNLLTSPPLNSYNLEYVSEGINPEDYVAQLNIEADQEREVLITENMANQEKSNLLFVYDGTKRVYHKRFIPRQLGYRVRDDVNAWSKVPSDQIPSGPDDYTKHFVMLGGKELGVDGAYLVCKPQFITNYMPYVKVKHNVQTSAVNAGQSPGDNVITYDSSTKCFISLSTKDSENKGWRNNKKFYNQNVYIKDLTKFLNDEIIFEWYNPNTMRAQYGEQPVALEFASKVLNEGMEYLITKYKTDSYSSSSGHTIKTYKYNYIFYENSNDVHHLPFDTITEFDDDMNIMRSSSSLGLAPNFKYPLSHPSGYSSYTDHFYDGWTIENLTANGYFNYGMGLTVTQNNIIKEVIPEHYEETGQNPYFIKDTYKPIPFSPWMIHSVHHSLDSALESAKTLVSMVGINNVKLVKNVPISQYIKVK